MKKVVRLGGVAWVAATVLLGGLAHAQARIETITIVGKRLEEDLPQVLAKTGIRVDTIGSSELRNGGYVDVSMPLQSLARGFYVAPKNGRFDYVDLSYQGSRTPDVLWLVDGARINNRLYAGTTPLDTIPASMVERIEILEGGQALFYGTQAVAGAVNIVTKGFTDEIDGAVSLGGGTQDQRHVDGYVRGSLPGAHQFVLYASHDQSEGFQPFPDSDFRPSSTDRHRGFNVTGVGGKYGRDFGEALRFTAGYHHTDAKLDFAQPTLVNTSFNERDEDLLHAKIDYSLGDQAEIFVKGYYHWWTSHFTEFDNEIDEAGMPTGTLTTVDDEAFWGFRDYGTNALAKVAVVPGLQSLLGYDFQNYTGNDAVLVIEKKTEHVHAFFVQLQTTPDLVADGVLAAGFRYNVPSVGESALVWNVNGIYHLMKELYARSAVGTAFRLPTAEELFANDPEFERGNPDLRPERTIYANAAVGGDLPIGPVPVRWEAVGFLRETKDLIDLETFDEITNQEIFGNIPGKVRVRGAELWTDAAITDEVAATFDFTYNRARRSGGGKLARVPETMIKAGADYHPGAWPFGLSMNILAIGDIEDTLGDIGRVSYGDYVVLNLAGRFLFDAKGRHRIGLHLNNVLDEEYTTRPIRGSEDLSDASFVVNNLGEPRSFFVSYTYALN